MKVYVCIFGDYEGENSRSLKVFFKEKDAEEYGKKVVAGNIYDYYVVECREVK